MSDIQDDIPDKSKPRDITICGYDDSPNKQVIPTSMNDKYCSSQKCGSNDRATCCASPAMCKQLTHYQDHQLLGAPKLSGRNACNNPYLTGDNFPNDKYCLTEKCDTIQDVYHCCNFESKNTLFTPEKDDKGNIISLKMPLDKLNAKIRRINTNVV